MRGSRHHLQLVCAALLGCGDPATTDTPTFVDPVPDETTPPGPTGTVPTPPTTTPPPTTPPTPDEPIVVTLALHPTIESLVTASWEQPADATARVEYSFDLGEWHASPDAHTPAGPAEVLLLGIPYALPVTVRVIPDVSTGVASPEVVITTGVMPPLPLPLIVADDPTQQEPTGKWLLGSINNDQGGWAPGKYWMFILDRKGRVVWAKRGINEDMTIYLQVSQDNDILWDQSTFWSEFDGGDGSKIHRMKLDGAETQVIDAPGMHHCFIEMPDRSIVWGSSTGFQTEVLRKIAPDGTLSVVWECEPFYDSLGLDDWCHTNSITYNPATDRFLLSFPTDDTFVLEVDGTTGEEIRWFGHIPQSYAFDLPTSAFQYQHGTTWTPEGTLLLSSHLSPSDDDALVREYIVDDATQTLTQIWAFGQGDGIDAANAGEAHRLPNGNTLHNTGTDPRVRELTPDGEVVWDVKWSGDRLLGRTIFLDDLYPLAP